MRLYNLDALSITLSKLQGAPLKSANYLEGKETNSVKKLSWTTLKQHLTSNYSEIPYDTHVINAYNTLQQGTDKSTKDYLHRVQDILECIHHTNDVSSVTSIGTNHAKSLTGLKDGKLCNKLAESKAKEWTNVVQVLQNVLKWQSTSRGQEGTLYHLLKLIIHQLIAIAILILVSITGPPSYLQKKHSNPKA